MSLRHHKELMPSERMTKENEGERGVVGHGRDE